MAALNVNGTDYWGFTPENHVGETPTVTAPKYAVYDYLSQNKVDPLSAWAPGVADAMNKRFNTNQFAADDDETLRYGDEFIHSGYGGQGARSTPQGTPAFTWGVYDQPGQAQQGMSPAVMQAIAQLFQQPKQQQASPFQMPTDVSQLMQMFQQQPQTGQQTGQTQTSQPQQSRSIDIGQIIEQALQRAFLGG